MPIVQRYLRQPKDQAQDQKEEVDVLPGMQDDGEPVASVAPAGEGQQRAGQDVPGQTPLLVEVVQPDGNASRSRASVLPVKAGARGTNGLLQMGGTRKGRQELAKATGFSPKTILEWVNRADLFRVKGVGTQYSDLLEASGWTPRSSWQSANPKRCWRAWQR